MTTNEMNQNKSNRISQLETQGPPSNYSSVILSSWLDWYIVSEMQQLPYMPIVSMLMYC